MYQKLIIVGNLGTDPELKYTPSGVPVTTLSVAVNRSWVGNDGQRAEKTIWIRVTCWRKLAETVSEYLKKGRRILVEGELEPARGYIDRAGEPAASIEMTASIVRFMDNNGNSAELESEAGAGSAAPSRPNNANRSTQAAANATILEEDIPF